MDWPRCGAASGVSFTCGRFVPERSAPEGMRGHALQQHQETTMTRKLSLPGLLRRLVLPMSLAAGLAAAGTALAQDKEDIVIGGSIPMSGVFSFAGVGIHAGMGDYVKMLNDAGGIDGRQVRYVPEDTGYKVDVSVAAFKKITSQNKVNLYYG